MRPYSAIELFKVGSRALTHGLLTSIAPALMRRSSWFGESALAASAKVAASARPSVACDVHAFRHFPSYTGK